MIRCNLAVLLAERNLKITKVSNDTGISRTTLTSLANNYSQGIQFDTINTLCNYLRISPEQLIAYVPVDIKVNEVLLDGDNLDITLTIIKNNRSSDCSLTGTYHTSFSDGKLNSLDIFVEFWDEEIDSTVREENLIISDAFSSISVPFLEDIKSKIFYKTISKLEEDTLIADPVDFSLSFDSSLIIKH